MIGAILCPSQVVSWWSRNAAQLGDNGPSNDIRADADADAALVPYAADASTADAAAADDDDDDAGAHELQQRVALLEQRMQELLHRVHALQQRLETPALPRQATKRRCS